MNGAPASDTIRDCAGWNHVVSAPIPMPTHTPIAIGSTFAITGYSGAATTPLFCCARGVYEGRPPAAGAVADDDDDDEADEAGVATAAAAGAGAAAAVAAAGAGVAPDCTSFLAAAMRAASALLKRVVALSDAAGAGGVD